MHKQKILDLSKQLIALETVKGNSHAFTEALKLFQSQLDDFNVKPFFHNDYESLLFSSTDTTPKKFKVILNAHLDVVPGEPSQFKPKVKGDKLIGRGAYDMKAAAIVELLAFKHVAKKVNYPLGLQIVTDEEQGINTSTQYQVKKGVKTDFALVGESSCKLNIKYKSKGLLWLKINFQGQSSHSAYPWLGDNAIKQASEFINKLYQALGYPREESQNTTVNVSKISTNNNAINKTPNDCLLDLDVRFSPKDQDTILTQITNLLPKTAVYEIVMFDPASYTSPHNPFIQQLVKSANKHQIEPKLIGTHGSSDIRFYTRVGSGGVEFGPVGDGDHKEHEWVSIKSLQTYYQILTDWLLSLNN